MNRKQRLNLTNILLIWIWTLFYSINFGLSVQEFEVEPKSLTVKYGKAVNFPCKVKNRKGIVQWTMDGFGLGTDRELKGYNRFSILGSDDAGNYTLHISAALLADEKVFQCQVSGVGEDKAIRSSKAKLTVVYPPKDDPENVYISPSSPLQTVAGSTVRVTCRGGLTKPPSKITWKKGDKEIKKKISKTVDSLSNSLLKSVTSWVDLKPDRTYNGENISCIISHEALKEPIVRTIRMYVQYPPEVTIAKHFIKAKEGDKITFTCTANGNPSDLRYRWEVNSIAAVGDHSTEFSIDGVKRDLNKAKVSCIVSNAIGNGRAVEVITVEYEPAFTKEPQNQAADEDKEVTLKCIVDSNPPAEVVWTHEHSQKVLGHGAEWKLKVNKNTRGVYRCRAAAPGFSEISRTMEVFLKGQPYILSDQLSYGIDGTTSRVECRVDSTPKADSVQWSRSGVTINTKNSVIYEAEAKNTSRGKVFILVIRDTPPSAFGFYNCSATNSYGTTSALVELRKNESLPLITTLVAIIGGIFFLFIVVVVVVLFRRQALMGYKDKNSSSKSTSGDSRKKSIGGTSGSDLYRQSEGDSPDDEWDVSDTTSATRNLYSGREQPEIYRFSSDYSEHGFPQKGQNTKGSAGYIPYVDYNKDYNPTPTPINYNRNSLYSSVPLNNVDPRFSAAYGNPYLKGASKPNMYGTPQKSMGLTPKDVNINLATNNLNNPNAKNILNQSRNVFSQNKLGLGEEGLYVSQNKQGEDGSYVFPSQKRMQGTQI